MPAFNFEVKRGTYEIAVKEAQASLSDGDLPSGSAYVKKARALCAELVSNAQIPELRARYSRELAKLDALSLRLERGENPFAKKAIPQGTPSPIPTESPGKTPAFFKKEPPQTRLRDVAGLADVKREIRLKVIIPMKDPALYAKYFDEAGCQILMYGPPGCGKSFVAEAIAGELGCAYAILGAQDLLDKYVGEGPKKVAALFEEANGYDRCLIFLDELDSVFSSRESEDSRHTKDVLTALLTAMSGFHASQNGAVKVLIGATNRPWALDSALLRGKRFDTHIYVGLPDREARLFLVRKAFKKNPGLLDASLGYERLADLFDGYSCADLSAMLGKMKERALSREVEALERGEKRDERVTWEDAEAVKSSYRNSVDPASLEAFTAFGKGEI